MNAVDPQSMMQALEDLDPELKRTLLRTLSSMKQETKSVLDEIEDLRTQKSAGQSCDEALAEAQDRALELAESFERIKTQMFLMFEPIEQNLDIHVRRIEQKVSDRRSA